MWFSAGCHAQSGFSEFISNSISAPADLATTPGDGRVSDFTLAISRQVIYSPSLLAIPGNTPIYITEVRFRLDEAAPSNMDLVIPHYSLKMGTYEKALTNYPEIISHDILGIPRFYSPNDLQTVYREQPIHLVGSSGAEPNPFDLRIPVVPFYYDPNAGGLFVETMNFQYWIDWWPSGQPIDSYKPTNGLSATGFLAKSWTGGEASISYFGWLRDTEVPVLQFGFVFANSTVKTMIKNVGIAQFQLSAVGLAGKTYQLQISTNAIDWSDSLEKPFIGTFITNWAPSKNGATYYRAVAR